MENRRNVKKRVKSEVRCVEAYFYSLMTECHKGIIIFLAITAESSNGKSAEALGRKIIIPSCLHLKDQT